MPDLKFEWFERLRYLESHTKNSAEFDEKLHTLTQQDAMKLLTAMKQEEARDSKNCMIL